MLALTLPIGLVVGITLGALGGGGSILTVPALVYLLGLDPRSATTGSLVIVGVTTLIGMLPHLRARRADVRIQPAPGLRHQIAGHLLQGDAVTRGDGHGGFVNALA